MVHNPKSNSDRETMTSFASYNKMQLDAGNEHYLLLQKPFATSRIKGLARATLCRL